MVPVNPRTFTEYMEQLQEGYVAAVAATAGCSMEYIARDVHGLDVEFIRPGLDPTVDEEISVRAQLKNTTTKKPDTTNGWFSYQFSKRESFLHLSKKRRTAPKAILIVMVTSPIQADWTSASHDLLEVRHCCYWRSLEGEVPKDGVQSPSIRIPTSNIFDASALSDILDKIDKGGAL
ncbi:DUF4365 domain-containing protein [Actinokineospora sp. PR83]|uniref:DUF4365 domain-containing protein n=1 Tax=Actinokineospora sp. PR83 TaxID=2884908 RepID=UPI0027E09019|nr:DUF4365 domain-containing protein [Actinokineospora sp. PR83]MCG8916958.1 DUF4365 domain-containing protein [Actinokineospora sp. PR83]